jgi:hypothetical protein
MGIDTHALNFIRYAEKQQPLGSVATIGRQGLHISKAKLRSIFPSARNCGPYCEELLIDFLGATKVESFDNSDYEQATYIADMNLPIECAETFDTVLDAGTLEHIYNAAQALKNVSGMCAEGGQILHILPANNQCGHGFWQFTPELFHSLYSQANGFSETTVFLASFDNEAYWYEVEAPSNGQRIIIQSVGPLYVLCRTKKGSHVSHDHVQQSDYVYAWDRKKLIEPDPNLFKKLATDYLKGSPVAPALRALNNLFGRVSISRNPSLTKRSVAHLIAKRLARTSQGRKPSDNGTSVAPEQSRRMSD